MDIMLPVTSIVLTNESEVEILSILKTVKEKPVDIDIDRDEIKIERGYTWKEKVLKTKQKAIGKFSMFLDIDKFKELDKNTEDVTTFENIKVEFNNTKNGKKFILYNCNIKLSLKAAFKSNKGSMIDIVATAQGENGIYYDYIDL